MTREPARRDGPIVLFDGVCVFCSTSMRFIARHDRTRSLRFAALQGVTGRALAAEHGLKTDDPDTFYVLADGRVLDRSRALLFVARCLARPWSAFVLFGMLPERYLDAGYAVLVRNRYRIAGRRPVCFVPTADERARFLT